MVTSAVQDVLPPPAPSFKDKHQSRPPGKLPRLWSPGSLMGVSRGSSRDPEGKQVFAVSQTVSTDSRASGCRTAPGRGWTKHASQNTPARPGRSQPSQCLLGSSRL